MKNINYLDRFLYKLLFSTVLLVISFALDYFNVININKVQNEMRSNINILKTIQVINGKVNLIDLGYGDEIAVSNSIYEYDIIDGKEVIKTNSLTGVNAHIAGVVVRIEKTNNKYTLTIVGIDDKTYVYSLLDSIDVHIYSYVKTNEIIGKSKNYYCLDIINDESKQ